MKTAYNFLIRSTIIVYLMAVYLSFFTDVISIYSGGVTLYLIYFLPILLFLMFPVKDEDKLRGCQIFYSKMLRWFFVFFFVYFVFFQLLSDKVLANNYFGVIMDLGFFKLGGIMPVFIISYFMLRIRPISFNKKLMGSVLLILSVNIALTLLLLSKEPNASKILGTSRGLAIYGLTGASGFNITYSAVLLVPVLLYGLNKFKKWNRLLWTILTALTLLFIYKCAYTLAILATILAIILYIFFSLKTKYKYLLLIPGLFILYMSFNTTFIYQLFLSLSYRITIYEVAKRFEDIANFVMFRDMSPASLGRLELYRMSINAFFKSPILGIFAYYPNYTLSGHSTILDIMGGSGILGLIPFLFTLYYSFKASLSYVGHQYRKCIYTSYIIIILLGLLNPILNSPSILCTLVFILPMMSLLFKEPRDSR